MCQYVQQPNFYQYNIEDPQGETPGKPDVLYGCPLNETFENYAHDARPVVPWAYYSVVKLAMVVKYKI